MEEAICMKLEKEESGSNVHESGGGGKWKQSV